MLVLFSFFPKLTLHEGTECMEKTVDGNVAESSLGSYSSGNSVIEKLFVAIPTHQRLRENGESFRSSRENIDILSQRSFYETKA